MQEELGRFSARIGSTARTFTHVRFVDTNVLLYVVSTDADEQEKASRANAILSEPKLGLSVHVL